MNIGCLPRAAFGVGTTTIGSPRPTASWSTPSATVALLPFDDIPHCIPDQLGWLAGMWTRKRSDQWCPVDGSKLTCVHCLSAGAHLVGTPACGRGGCPLWTVAVGHEHNGC